MLTRKSQIISLFGISKSDISSFMSYLYEKVAMVGDPAAFAIRKYKDVHLFGNFLLKRKLERVLAELEEGEDIADVLYKEYFLTKTQHQILRSAHTIAMGLSAIEEQKRKVIPLAAPIAKAFFWWSMLPITFFPMSGEMGKAVRKQIEMVSSMRNGGEDSTIELPFYFNDPWAFYFGVGSTFVMLFAPLFLFLLKTFSFPAYLKINKLKECEDGLAIITPLAQMSKAGITLQKGFEYLYQEEKDRNLKRLLSNVLTAFESGEGNLSGVFAKYGFGREIGDTFDAIETGSDYSKALVTLVESLEIRRAKIRQNYANMIPLTVKFVVWIVLGYILLHGFLSYFDAFLGM